MPFQTGPIPSLQRSDPAESHDNHERPARPPHAKQSGVGPHAHSVSSRDSRFITAVFVLSACESTSEVKEDEVPDPTTTTDQQDSGATTQGAGTGTDTGGGFQGNPLDDPASLLSTRIVYFEYDSSEITGSIVRWSKRTAATWPTTRPRRDPGRSCRRARIARIQHCPWRTTRERRTPAHDPARCHRLAASRRVLRRGTTRRGRTRRIGVERATAASRSSTSAVDARTPRHDPREQCMPRRANREVRPEHADCAAQIPRANRGVSGAPPSHARLHGADRSGAGAGVRPDTPGGTQSPSSSALRPVGRRCSRCIRRCSDWSGRCESYAAKSSCKPTNRNRLQQRQRDLYLDVDQRTAGAGEQLCSGTAGSWSTGRG